LALKGLNDASTILITNYNPNIKEKRKLWKKGNNGETMSLAPHDLHHP